jgi:hypothetical protein
LRLKPRVEADPPKELRFRLEAETFQELELYGLLYAEEYGQAIDTPALAAEILRQFLEGDRSFRVWKRRRPNGVADRPKAGGAGTLQGRE